MAGAAFNLMPWAPTGLMLAPYPTPPSPGDHPLSLSVVFVMLTQVADLETDPEGADEEERLEKQVNELSNGVPQSVEVALVLVERR